MRFAGAVYDDIMAVRVAKQQGFVDCTHQTEKLARTLPGRPADRLCRRGILEELTARRRERFGGTEVSGSKPGREKDRGRPEAAYPDRIRRDAAEGRC